MSQPQEDRRREYPGDRFSQRIIQQDLDEVARQLREEEFGEGHLEQGHNQIELYREGGTTVSLFVMEKGAHLREHTVDDGSVMIQVLEGTLCLQTEDAEDHLHPGQNSLVVLEAGVGHSIQAEKPSRFLLTIMRDQA